MVHGKAGQISGRVVPDRRADVLRPTHTSGVRDVKRLPVATSEQKIAAQMLSSTQENVGIKVD